MKMNLFFIRAPHLLKILCLAGALSLTGASFVSGHGPGFPKVGTIAQTANGVAIQVKDQKLFDVAQALEQVTGVKFRVAGHLGLDLISADINQPDWPSAIRRLLVNYSTVEIGSNPLGKVMILDRTGDMEIVDEGQALAQENKSPGGFAYRPAKRIQKKIWAKERIPYTKAQLELLLGDTFRSAIPEEIFHDPSFRALLTRHEIKKPEDLAHLPKAMQVKTEAGKLYRVLQKREYLQQNPR
ncbi:MAG: hypothetical protein G3M78_02525 [Candidatus Nitrohelix vancouverensis]|uniref:POTRA domain-containing protein n=1 Tax=Candidatus Nitrohelix vancouverensis TaxID=2705534 RepID=A0A7T0C0L0_9BACT|nr:MAG: hypothetical protein G3M78_02525 [Candidatus Nitrohelix vancouverensis]